VGLLGRLVGEFLLGEPRRAPRPTPRPGREADRHRAPVSDVVGLVFTDGSEVRLPSGDPRIRAFRAVVGQISRRD